MRVMKHWHRLAIELVDAPSQETFQVRFHRAFRHLISLKISLPLGIVRLDDL